MQCYRPQPLPVNKRIRSAMPLIYSVLGAGVFGKKLPLSGERVKVRRV